jgi:hypothetical protein
MKRHVGVIAVATSLLAAAPAPAARVYGGQPGATTPFQSVLTLSDDGRRVTGLVFEFDVACPAEDFRSVGFGRARIVPAPPAAPDANVPYLVAPTVRNGRLSARLSALRTGEELVETLDAKLTGTISPRRLSGRLAMSLQWRSASTGDLMASCRRTIRVRALRRPGIVYGGSSSQDAPVVLELTRDRTRVSHAHFSWFAPCRNAGSWNEEHDEFDLRPLPLSPAGAFSGSYTFRLEDGWVERSRFAGRVGPARASGTFRGSASNPDVDTCSIGPLTWSARTG